MGLEDWGLGIGDWGLKRWFLKEKGKKGLKRYGKKIWWWINKLKKNNEDNNELIDLENKKEEKMKIN